MSPCNFGTYEHQANTESKAASTLQTCTSLFSKCPTWWRCGNLVVSVTFNLEKGTPLIADLSRIMKYFQAYQKA